MKLVKGHLVKEWVRAVDALCDSDPTYDWNDACRAVAHALENENTVTLKKIEKAAKEYWGNDDSRDYSITVGDLHDCLIRMPAVPRENEDRPISIMRPIRFRK